MNLAHVGSVAADGGEVAALLAAFGGGEVLGWEKWGGARGAEEEGVGLANPLFQESRVLAVLWREDAELEFGVGGAEFGKGRVGVEFMHQGFGAGEGPVDDVDVVDGVTAEDEGQADVPGCLFAGAEDGDGVDVGAAREDHGRGEGGAEGGQLFCCDETVGDAG